MNRLCGLLALFFGSLLCASSVFARGSLATWPHANNPIPAARAAACTLDVVLVTFQDANQPSTLPNYRNYDYHAYDRPYGEVSGRLTAASYRRHDFLRMLAGGYDDGGGHSTPFVGRNITVANSHRLPEVFGSVRAYFDFISNGAFQLHVRIVNPPAEGTGDFPRWIELPGTKEYYAESTTANEFWDAAYQATQDSLSSSDTAWRTGISLPHHDEADYPFSRLLRRKILFLYSGVVFNNRVSQLHPRVDRITNETPTPPILIIGRPAVHTVGYRYVMGERQGLGNTAHGVDEFAGIGMHAHEIGHLLGLWHGGGNWTDPTRYGTDRRLDRYGNTTAPNNVVTGGANHLGWTLMQGGGDQGPIMDEGYTHNGYYIAYRSCPNPINPFYLRDLGWLTPTEVLGSQDDYRIAPGTTHRIDRGAVEFLLNRRTLQPFGGRYVSFYDYAAENAVSQGLMIWRRTFRTDPSRQNFQDQWQYPLLIVADERRYHDARDQDQSPNIPEYHDMLSDPFATGRIEAPDGYDEFDQDNMSAVSGLNAGAGLRQATSGVNRDPTSLNLALTNIDYDSTTDTITVDIYMARPSPPTNVTAVVSNGQMTLDWEAPSDPGPPPNYRYRQSTDGTWGRPIDVAATEVPIGRLVPSTAYAFEVWSVNPLGSSDRVSISPLMLEGPSAIAFPEVVAPEAERRTVANYTATDPEGDMIEWSLAGTDADDFVLSSDGQLTFQDDPDFEDPTDRDHPPDQEPPTDEGENNTYHLIIQARAGQQSATLDVTVTVADADDPGVIVLSSQSPQIRVPLTAVLTDPDGGLTGVRWQWQAHAPDATEWQPLSSTSAAVPSRFTPQAAQVGRALRAVVTGYGDRFGTGKSAQSEATLAVPAGVPDTPVLQAFGKNGEVRLNIKLVADNGSPITRTETRVYSVSQGDTTWRTTKGTWAPHSIDPDPSIYPNFFASGRTVSWDALTNGVTYTFEVRSVNGVGTSAIALTPATAGHTTWLSGGLLPLTASGGAGQVVLNWTPGANWQVAQYEVQSRVARSGHGWSVWSPVPGGGSMRDTTIAGLLNGTEYEFMVRAVNEKGEPLAASNVVLATPADRPGVPVLTAAGGDGQVVLDWTAAAAHGSVLVRYEMRLRVADSGHGWPEWSPVPGGGSARDTTVAGLLNGTAYEFAVRAVNGVGAGASTSVKATPQGSSTLAVSFGSATYAAQEGGAGVSIGVGLSPSSSQPVHIPVVVAADKGTEPDDYTVSGLSAGAVVFAAGASSSSFTITANEDADRDDETVSVSFGTLPAGVVAVGTTRQATVTLRDNDGLVTPLAVRDLASRSTGLTSGQASWNLPRNAVEAKVGSYRYRLDGGTVQTTTTTSASFSSLQPGRRYLVDVWAVGSGGAGPIATTTFTTESGVAPVLASVGPLDCYVGEYCSFTFPATTRGTAPITYTVSPPSWAKASGRSFSGTAPSSPGTASASLNASNAYGMDSESLTINIEKRTVAGVAPVLDPVGPLDCYVGEYCSFTFPVAKKGTEPITYRVSPPSWAKASGRGFAGTAPSSPGTASASLNASNAYGTDSESLTINVKKRGYRPVLASVSSVTCYVGEYCSFTFPAATSGTAPITYKVSPPSWAKASGSRGFAGTAPSSPGTFSASLNASNVYGTDSESVTIKVQKRGYPPVLASVSSITCYVGEYCSFTFPAATSGTAPITYKVSPPSWAKASGSRGFAGAAPSSPGTFSASISASNSYGTDSESLTIKVQRRLAIAPGVPSAPSTAAGAGIGVMAGRIGMPARRPKSAS